MDDYRYRLKVYGMKRGFTLTRKYYEGEKPDEKGKKIPSYNFKMVVDGRSKEWKDRMDSMQQGGGIPGVMVSTDAGEINFDVETDKRAKQAVIQLVFTHTDRLGLK